jgi:acetyltransferase
MPNALTEIDAAAYPSELDEDLVLPSQRRLRIRPLFRDEDGAVRELYAQLSPRTRYRRFLSPMPMLPDALLKLLVTVDYQRRLALVVQSGTGPRREIVALGSFSAVDDECAEVALVVRDDWQEQRIGTLLARRVLQAAEDRGFHRFAVHLLSENVAARRILAQVGDVVAARVSGGVSELTFVRARQIDR